MDAEKMLKLQMQISQNNSDVLDYVKDLDNWQENVKKKEESLKEIEEKLCLPEIRNKISKISSNNSKAKNVASNSKKRNTYSDYSSWDKYDVDQACQEIDKDSSLENKEDVDTEISIFVEKLKTKGNLFFQKGKYIEAVESYTKGLELDPNNITLIANRALVLLKQEKYAASELDCTAALALDDTHIKALLRRGTARSKLKKYKEALVDFEKVLSIEKENKQAISEVASLKQLLQPVDMNSTDVEVNQTGIVKAIYKPIDQRSKKPLKRIHIVDINFEPIKNEPIKNEPIKDKKNVSINCIQAESVPVLETLNKKSIPLEIKNTLSLPQNEAESNVMLSQNSIQFQKAWKEFGNDDKLFFSYFVKLSPLEYPKIFGEFLEYNMLSKVFKILKDFYIINNVDYKIVLLNLPRVSRFQMNMMFQESKDKNILIELISSCKNLSSQEDKYLRDVYQIN